MPKEAQKDPEVQSLMEQYAVRMKKFYWWNVAGAVLFRSAWHLAYTSSYVWMDVLGFFDLRSEVWAFSV